jgi:hypothetical protein
MQDNLRMALGTIVRLFFWGVKYFLRRPTLQSLQRRLSGRLILPIRKSDLEGCGRQELLRTGLNGIGKFWGAQAPPKPQALERLR